MNPYINEDTEIDLVGLIKYLLRKCVWILIMGVICAGIAAVFKYSASKTTVTDQAEIVVARSEYEVESELYVASDASTLSLINDHKNYLQNSLLMKLDPYHVWRETTVVYVNSKTTGLSAKQITKIYRKDLMSGDYLQELAKKRDTDSSYLMELVKFEGYDSECLSVEDSEEIIVDMDDIDKDSSQVFTIKAYGSTEEEAHALMQAVLSEAESLQKRIGEEYDHDLAVVNSNIAEVLDTSIRDTQKSHMTYTGSLASSMKDNDDKSVLLSPPVDPAASAASSGISKKTILKYGIIGFVIGAFFAFIWLVFRYITNDKLVNYKDLEQKGISLKELGSVQDQGIAMVSANIRNFAGEKKKLFLTGMAEESQYNKVCKEIQEYLSEYEIVSAGNVLHDPDAREKLLNCDAAVLVEQKKVTRYSQMEEEITFLFNAQKPIIGIVIV